MKQRHSLLVTLQCAILAACAAPANISAPASMTIPLSGSLQAISDVQGPFGAVLYGDHAVAIRLWPDSLDDGLAEITVIVTNGSWNTIKLDIDAIELTSGGSNLPALGKEHMLARLSSSDSQSGSDPSTLADSRLDRDSKPESTTPQGGMGRAPQSDGFGSLSVDPTLTAATRQAGSIRRPASASTAVADIAEQRKTIEAWYLDSVEIYPGDTGTGGISIVVPDSAADLQLHIRVGDEDYEFPISYQTGYQTDQ